MAETAGDTSMRTGQRYWSGSSLGSLRKLFAGLRRPSRGLRRRTVAKRCGANFRRSSGSCGGGV